tara:strand:- start:732 stop:1247 length:516 start_codon:yes stop_codon:yes gene_type:complete
MSKTFEINAEEYAEDITVEDLYQPSVRGVFLHRKPKDLTSETWKEGHQGWDLAIRLLMDMQSDIEDCCPEGFSYASYMYHNLLDYLEQQDGEELTTTYDLITGFINYLVDHTDHRWIMRGIKLGKIRVGDRYQQGVNYEVEVPVEERPEFQKELTGVRLGDAVLNRWVSEE